jgi:hypothetical protein
MPTMSMPKNPLSHLISISHAAKLCSPGGVRLPTASWSFTLSAAPSANQLVCKTVGFQSIDPSAGLTFIVRSGSLSPSPSIPISICHVSGSFPPVDNVPCRQWRMEGLALRCLQPMPSILESAPQSSLAQMLATADFAKQGPKETSVFSPLDRPSFLELVNNYKKKLSANEVSAEQIHDEIDVFTLMPQRVELLESGEIWDRTEWWLDETTGSTFQPPVKRFPY